MTEPPLSDQGGPRRIAETAALLALVLAVVLAVVFSIEDWVNLVVPTLGVALAVTGGWYAVANRGTVRWVAALVAVLGLAVALIGLLAARTGMVEMFLAGALNVLSPYSVPRYATNRSVTAVRAGDLGAPRRQHGTSILIMNSKSGGQGTAWSSSAGPAGSSRCSWLPVTNWLPWLRTRWPGALT